MADTPTSKPEGATPLTFDATHQQTLHEELMRMSPDLAGMYYGALCCLRQQDNPERFYQAAHSLRELLDNAPKHLSGVPVRDTVSGLQTELRPMQQAWEKVATTSWYASNPGDNQPLDGPMKLYMEESEKFFNMLPTRPSRADQAVVTARLFDRHKGTLPEALEKAQAQVWNEFDRYFTNACHHGSTEEFEDWLYRFEQHLLGEIRPQTFDEQAELDKVIEAGEQ